MINRLLWIACWFVLPLSATAQIKNIKLDEKTETNRACEPSIAINPRDTKNIVAASVLDNVYYTFDGGVTWNKSKITSPLGVYGDPVVVASDKGDFFYFHLSDPTGEGWKNEKSLEHIVCHQSKDGGKTWDEGVAIGTNPPKDQDKPWATIDDKGNVYVAWTQFDKYASDDPNCLSTIMLSTSSNGKKWSKPVQLSQTPGDCKDSDNTVMGGMPAVSHDGKVFAVWAHQNKLWLDRSFDGGSMWLRNDIGITAQPGGWDQAVPGHNRTNGLPVLQLDRAKLSPARGSIFLVWADQRKGETDTDIWFLRSSNYGDYWTTPLRINNDAPGSHQYFPWMTVDQVTGYIYIVYYDRREYEDNQTDVYLAYSVDSGNSFKNIKISEAPFTPDTSSFFGDYNNISAHKGIITPIWTRMDNGVTSVWTCVIKQEELEKMK